MTGSALTGDTREPLLHDAAARRGVQIWPPAGTATWPLTAARHGAVLVFHPGGGDAHPVIPPWNLDEMALADPAARPGRGYEQGQPAARREQDSDEPADRDAGQSGARITRQNGRGSAKVAVMRTAPSARTLYTLCTQPLLCIDPQ
jgi:hypothetical protein